MDVYLLFICMLPFSAKDLADVHWGNLQMTEIVGLAFYCDWGNIHQLYACCCRTKEIATNRSWNV